MRAGTARLDPDNVFRFNQTSLAARDQPGSGGKAAAGGRIPALDAAHRLPSILNVRSL